MSDVLERINQARKSLGWAGLTELPYRGVRDSIRAALECDHAGCTFIITTHKRATVIGEAWEMPAHYLENNEGVVPYPDDLLETVLRDSMTP